MEKKSLCLIFACYQLRLSLQFHLPFSLFPWRLIIKCRAFEMVSSLCFQWLFKIVLITMTEIGKFYHGNDTKWSAAGEEKLKAIIWTPLEILALFHLYSVRRFPIQYYNMEDICNTMLSIFGFKVHHYQAAYDMCQNTYSLCLQIDLCHCIKIGHSLIFQFPLSSKLRKGLSLYNIYLLNEYIIARMWLVVYYSVGMLWPLCAADVKWYNDRWCSQREWLLWNIILELTALKFCFLIFSTFSHHIYNGDFTRYT